MSADAQDILDLTSESRKTQALDVCTDCASPNAECISREPEEVLVDYGRMAPHQRALRALMSEDIESFRACLKSDPEVCEKRALVARHLPLQSLFKR